MAAVVELLLVAAMWAVCSAKTIYVRDMCNQNYIVDGDVRVKLSDSSYFYSHSDSSCTLTLTPRTRSRLTARFESYTQGDPPLFTSRCSKQAIYINDYYSGGYCGFSKPDTNYDLGNTGRITFSIYGSSIIILGIKLTQATIVVTEVADKVNNACSSGDFDCQKDNACIHDDLKCNGINDCGNNRDEVEGCGLTTGIIVGIACGVVAFIVLVIVGVALFMRFR